MIHNSCIALYDTIDCKVASEARVGDLCVFQGFDRCLHCIHSRASGLEKLHGNAGGTSTGQLQDPFEYRGTQHDTHSRQASRCICSLTVLWKPAPAWMKMAATGPFDFGWNRRSASPSVAEANAKGSGLVAEPGVSAVLGVRSAGADELSIEVFSGEGLRLGYGLESGVMMLLPGAVLEERRVWSKSGRVAATPCPV